MSEKLKDVRILIVEDEEFLLEALVDEFQYAGAKVFSKKSGNQAIEFLLHESVEVIVTDIQMSDGDGVELLKMVNEKVNPIPVLCVCTGFTETTEEDFKALNVNEVFKKPFKWDVLINGIVKHLK